MNNEHPQQTEESDQVSRRRRLRWFALITSSFLLLVGALTWHMPILPATAVPIGALVTIAAEDLEVTLTSDKDRYWVGENATIRTTISNNSQRTIVLPRSLDGSSIGARYPLVEADLFQEDGMKVMEYRGHCGTFNSLLWTDLHTVRPGVGFDPFEGRISHRLPAFKKPGLHKIRWTYSTDSSDPIDWRCEEFAGSPAWIAGMIRVPKLNLVQEIEVLVLEKPDK